MTGRMPCRVSDDPYYNYSDYIEQEGVYAPYEEGPCEPEDLHPNDPLFKHYHNSTHQLKEEQSYENDKTKGFGTRDKS